MDTTIDTKEKLIAALQEAVTVEHGLLCQYLFAAFSLKQRKDEGVTPLQLEHIRNWKAMILQVARQEMGHLGTVCNLLAAIGEKPRFDNLDFPQVNRYFTLDLPVENPYFTVDQGYFILEPFGLLSLFRFIRFEMPEDELKRYRELRPTYETIGDLYKQIEDGFEYLVQGLGENQVFIGKPVKPEDVNNRRDITITEVTDLASSKRAIVSIIEEGEGLPSDSDKANSHYAKFKQIAAALPTLGASFEPARAVASSPRLTEDAKRPEIAVIRNKGTHVVASLFNNVYSTMLLMVARVWQIPNELTEHDKLQSAQAMARQLMSGVIRPLGELLTELPLDEPSSPPSPLRAGATFELDVDVNTSGDVRATWALFHERLQQAVQLASAAVHSFPDNRRLAIVQENLQLLAQTLHTCHLASSATKTGITIHFEGWFQCRLATDPDPGDELRGVSGWTFALGDEPDLDNVIRLHNAVAPRTWDGEQRMVGVTVRSVEVLGQQDEHHVLIGARVDLLDDPTYMGRNGIIGEAGSEFIHPFRLCIQASNITIERADHFDPSDPNKTLLEIDSQLLQHRRPVEGKIFEEDLDAITGAKKYASKAKKYQAYRNARKELLTGQLQYTTDELDRAVLQKRINELNRKNSQPEWTLGASLIYCFAINGTPLIHDLHNKLHDRINTSVDWPIEFWMGGWDADALCGYMKGYVVLPFM